MRQRLATLRRAFADALGDRWSNSLAIGRQEGMFSLLPVTPADVMALREKHGVYMPTSGRINIAGLKLADVARVAGLFKAL